MATSRTMAAVAAAAFVLGAAVAAVVALTLDGAPGHPGGAVSEAAGQAARDLPRSPALRAATPGPASGSTTEPALAGLADLAPTDEERVWMTKALVAERERRVAARIRPEASGVEVVRRYFRHGANVEPVLGSFAAARAHVPSPAGEPVRFTAPADGKPTDPSLAAGASVVEFGPGRFDLRESRRSFIDRSKPVPSLEIRGAGKDATTLVVDRSQEMMLLDESQTLVVRDLTIECPEGDSSIVSVRGGASLVLDGVRIAGMRLSMLAVMGEAFVACRDCEFLSGDGGMALMLDGPVLAAFEKCTFADMRSAFYAFGFPSGGRTCVMQFLDCTFLDAGLADSRIRRTTGTSIDFRVRGGRVELLGAAASEGERRKAWGAEFATSVEGVTFAASAVRFSVADLVRVLDLAEARGWTPVVHTSVVRRPRGFPTRIDLYVAPDRRVGRRLVDVVGGGLVDVRDERSGSASIDPQSAADVAGLLSLRALLASQPDLAASEVDSVAFTRAQVDGAERWQCYIRMEGGRGSRHLDATSGAVVVRR